MIIFKAKPEVIIDETLAKQVQQFISHDGNSDNDLYIGSTQLSVPNYGMIPVQFNLDAKNIVEAFENYDAALEKEIERIAGEQKDLENQIVTRSKEIII